MFLLRASTPFSFKSGTSISKYIHLYKHFYKSHRSGYKISPVMEIFIFFLIFFDNMQSVDSSRDLCFLVEVTQDYKNPKKSIFIYSSLSL